MRAWAAYGAVSAEAAVAASHQPNGPAPTAASVKGIWTSAVSTPTANRILKMLQPLPRTSSRERESEWRALPSSSIATGTASAQRTREHEARDDEEQEPERDAEGGQERDADELAESSSWTATSTSPIEVSASPSWCRPRTISTRPPCSSAIPATLRARARAAGRPGSGRVVASASTRCIAPSTSAPSSTERPKSRLYNDQVCFRGRRWRRAGRGRTLRRTATSLTC